MAVLPFHPRAVPKSSDVVPFRAPRQRKGHPQTGIALERIGGAMSHEAMSLQVLDTSDSIFPHQCLASSPP